MLRHPSLTCCVATCRRTGIWIKVLGTGQPNRSPHGWYAEIRCAVAPVSPTSAFPSGSDDAHVGERRALPPIGRANEDICDTVFPAGNLAHLNGKSARPLWTCSCDDTSEVINLPELANASIFQSCEPGSVAPHRCLLTQLPSADRIPERRRDQTHTPVPERCIHTRSRFLRLGEDVFRNAGSADRVRHAVDGIH